MEATLPTGQKEIEAALAAIRADSQPTPRGIILCASVMSQMIRMGWRKDDLDSLEILYWQTHDGNGELLPGTSVGRGSKRSNASGASSPNSSAASSLKPKNHRTKLIPEETMKLNPLDLEDAFDDYMRRVLPGIPNHAVQYRESRRAFVAGARRLFVYMTQEVVTLSDYDAEKELQRLDKEMKVYWKRACEDRD